MAHGKPNRQHQETSRCSRHLILTWIHTCIVMNEEMSCRIQNHVLFQAVNMLSSTVKCDIFIMRLYEDRLSFGASSGHLKNCSCTLWTQWGPTWCHFLTHWVLHQHLCAMPNEFLPENLSTRVEHHETVAGCLGFWIMDITHAGTQTLVTCAGCVWPMTELWPHPSWDVFALFSFSSCKKHHMQKQMDLQWTSKKTGCQSSLAPPEDEVISCLGFATQEICLGLFSTANESTFCARENIWSWTGSEIYKKPQWRELKIAVRQTSWKV